MGGGGAGLVGGGAAAGTMPGGEGVIGIDLGVVLLAEFFQDEERAGAHEGVGWEFGGDHRLKMAIAGAKATKQIKNLTRLGDGVADVAKLIGKAFQLGAVVVDGQVTLTGAAKLGLKIDSTLKFVVEEEPLDGRPQGEGGEVRRVDDVEDGLGDGVEDPVDDAGISQLPLAIALSRRGGRTDMRREPELAKDGVEEAPPLGIVAVVEIERHGNMGADVDCLENGGGGGRRGIEVGIERGVGVV